jgi:hypothetical protein
LRITFAWNQHKLFDFKGKVSLNWKPGKDGIDFDRPVAEVEAEVN